MLFDSSGNAHILADLRRLAMSANVGHVLFFVGAALFLALIVDYARMLRSELFDKRAATFSSRPRMIVFGELGFDQAALVSMKYGERFRVHRKLTHMGIGIQQVRSYQNLQSNENKVVLLSLLSDPENYALHLERYAASVVSIIGFGRRIWTIDDPIITEVIALMQKAAEHNVPGKSFPMLLETFPCMIPWHVFCAFLTRKFRYRPSQTPRTNPRCP